MGSLKDFIAGAELTDRPHIWQGSFSKIYTDSQWMQNEHPFNEVIKNNKRSPIFGGWSEVDGIEFRTNLG